MISGLRAYVPPLGAIRYSSPGLKPHKKQRGVYGLVRRAYTEEVILYEPSGDSYVLSLSDAERALRLVVGLSDADAERALDLLWNFRAVRFDSTTGWAVATRQADDVIPRIEEEALSGPPPHVTDRLDKTLATLAVSTVPKEAAP